jgi:hypothetical protein
MTTTDYPHIVYVILPRRTPRTAWWIENILGTMRCAAKRLAPGAHRLISGGGQLEIHVMDRLTALRLALINQEAIRAGSRTNLQTTSQN